MVNRGARSPGRARSAWRLGLVLLAAAGTARATRMPEPYYRLSDAVVTPHIAWAKPYCRGPLRVLAIAPRWTQRETLELAQRLDADITPVMTYGWDKFGLDPANPGWAAIEGAFLPDVEAEALAALEKEYDCIVMGAFAWNLLPRRVQYLILKKVRDGAGLVYFYPKVTPADTLATALARKRVTDDTGFITGSVPFAALSAFAPPPPEAKDQTLLRPDDFLDLHEFKAGRIALVRYPGRPDNLYCTPGAQTVGPELFAEYEYYQSLAIRTILWAARRESGFGLRMTSVPEGTVAAYPGLVFSLDNATGKAATVELAFTYRDLWGQELAAATQRLKAQPGANRVVSPPIHLLHGRQYLDLIVRQDGKVLTWGSVVFGSDEGALLAGLHLAKAAWEKTESVSATARLRRASPAPLRLVARLRDTCGRAWAGTTVAVPAGATEAALSLPLANALTVAHHVAVRLLDKDGGEHGRATAEFYVQQRDQSDFYLLQWPGGCRDYVGRMAMRQAARYGTDLISNFGIGEDQARALALENLRSLPYMTRYAGEADAQKLTTLPCFTDPEFLEAERRKLTETAAKLSKYSLAGYTLGDECFFLTKEVDACMSPSCNAGFAVYLRQEYGALDALNREWGTTLADWSQATPIALAEARKTGQFARWADHRMHMESTFAAVMRNADRAIRAVDPTARVGFDGPSATDSYAGYDWWKLSREFSMIGLYWHQPEQTEQMRCFLPPRTSPSGYWYGGYYGWRREAHERYVPWHTLLHGINTAWWFCLLTPAAPHDEENAFAPDLRPYPDFLWTVEECNAIKRGIGKLLLQARRRHDGIAILYSQASVHAATLFPTFGMANAAQNGIDWLLEDAGLQYDYLSYAELAQGELAKRGYRVLILPNCQAVADAEAKAIREFVAAGGLVLADVGAGRVDGHCRPAEPGMLDDVFGVRFAAGEPKTVPGILKPAAGDAPLARPEARVDADGSLQVTDGQALAAVEAAPALVLKRHGRGAAVLLNFPFAAYAGLRLQPASDAYVTLVNGILDLAGVRPRATFTAGTERLRNFEAVFFEDGANEYLAVLAQEGGPPEGRETTIRLDRACRAVDMREGVALGLTDQIRCRVQPGRTRLYSLLPYTVKAAKADASLDRATRVARVTATLKTSGAPVGTHCFHVEVTDPAGRPAPCYTRNVLAPAGQAEFAIPFAANDAPGRWTVRLTDAATAESATVRLRLPAVRHPGEEQP